MLRFTMVHSITVEADIVNGSNTKVIRNLFPETQKHVKDNINRKLDALDKFEKKLVKTKSVSYTHLTLPTICSV